MAYTSIFPSQPTVPHGLAADDVRVLHRVASLDLLARTSTPRMPLTAVALVDVETSGTDPMNDEVIEMAAVLVRIDAFGRLVEVVRAHDSLRTPTRPVSETIERITGITNGMLAGATFDPRPFVDLMLEADVCVAHNARSDIAFIEALFPELSNRAWACSMLEFPWLDEGFCGRALDHLLMQAGLFNAAHRAAADVLSLLNLTLMERGSEGTILGHILQRAQATSFRVEATGAPYGARMRLRNAGYCWSSDRRVWWKDVSAMEAPLEMAWLAEGIVPFNRVPRTIPVTWRERHR